MKHTLGSDTTLFAKELNLNPKDYKSGEIIDIAIKTIKSSDNPLVMERVKAYKQTMEKYAVEFKPIYEKVKKDKPGYDFLLKLNKTLNEDMLDYDVQDLLKEIEDNVKKSRVKEKTKPKGQSQSISKRNDKIRKKYYLLKQKRTQKEACNLLSKQFKLKPSTIETIVKK